MDWLFVAVLALLIALIVALHRYLNRPGGYFHSAEEPNAKIVELIKPSEVVTIPEDMIIVDDASIMHHGDEIFVSGKTARKLKQQMKSRQRKDKQ
jgi:lactam utilization protein B